MKRLGVQKSVIVMRDFVTSMVYSLVWAIVASLCYWNWLLKDQLGLEVMIVFAVLNVIQTGLRGILISQLLPGKFGFMLTVSILLF